MKKEERRSRRKGRREEKEEVEVTMQEDTCVMGEPQKRRFL